MLVLNRPCVQASRSSRLRGGLTLLELLVCLAVIGLLLGLILAGVQRSRHAAARVRCADQLRQLGLAHHNYHQQHGRLPPGMSSGTPTDPYPFLSWQARLLPYLEQGTLWKQIVEAFGQEPVFWKIPPHTGLATVVPPFICPLDSRLTSPAPVGRDGGMRAFTSYLGVEGTNAGLADGLLYIDSKHSFLDVTDGTSNTLLAGERPPSADLILGWWYAGWGQRKNGDAEMLLGVRTRNYGRNGPNCPEGPYHFTPGKLDDQCAAFHFWSPHAGGAHFLFADGSVRFLRYDADDILPALATRAGGEAVAVPD